MFSPSLPLEYYNAQTRANYYLNPYSGQYIRNKSYARRLQRGFARGLSQAESRGHRVSARGLSESAERRARAEERGSLSPYQVFLGGFERRYGFSYAYWRTLYRRWIAEINRRAWPQATSSRMYVDENGVRADPRIFPGDITAVKQLYDQGFRPERSSSPASWQEWVENQLAVKLETMIEYQDNHNRVPGKMMFASRSGSWMRTGAPAEAVVTLRLATAASAPPIEFWWYH